jgi:DNA-binding MarR family transcriptional regulator
MLQVLTHLWEKDGVNQQELANLLHKDKASLTYLIDNLSKRGLVKRTEDVDDRRNKIITLQPEAIRLRNVLRPWVDEMYAIAGKDIPVQQLKEATLMNEKMVENFVKKK